MVPSGMGSAVSAMLGEAIGGGHFYHALGLLKLATVMGVVGVSAYSLPLICARTVLAETLGGGVSVVEAQLTVAFPLILAIQLIDGVLNIFRSWLVVRKLQGFGAVQSIICYYCLAVPLGWFLAKKCNFGICGLWSGLGAGVIAITSTSAARIAMDIRQTSNAECVSTLETAQLPIIHQESNLECDSIRKTGLEPERPSASTLLRWSEQMDHPNDASFRKVLPHVGRLTLLSAASILQSMIDWSRPLIFNYFVSSGLKQSGLDVEQGAFEMDCVSTAVLTLNILCFATGYGFNRGIDALASLAFGADRPVELHCVLYRQVFLTLLLLAIIFPLVRNCAPFLLLLGQSSDHATRTAEILSRMAWAVPGELAYDCLGRWAKGQQRHRLVSACALLALSVNLVANTAWKDGTHPVAGPVRALVLQNTLLPILVLAALLIRRHRFIIVQFGDVKAGIGEQLKICTQAMVWNCAELWAWEVQVFEAAALGAGSAASYSILSSTYSFLIMVPSGMGSAVSAMLGEAIGGGHFYHALGLLKLATVMGVVGVSAYSLPLICARTVLAETLGGGVSVVEAQLTVAFPLILAIQLIDGVLNIFRSWLVVRKLQGFGAVQSIICYYCLAVPLGWFLAKKCNFGICGLWSGLGAAVIVITATSWARIAIDIRQASKVECVSTLEAARLPIDNHQESNVECRSTSET